MNPEQNRHTRLQRLRGSNFEISDNQPDIRGWSVKNGDGLELGKVEELIFDYIDHKVRYIAVNIKEAESAQNRGVLVPVGIAELHHEDDDVILPGVTMQQLSMLPAYEEDRFDAADETSIRNVFGGLGTGDTLIQKDDDFYSHRHFNEENITRNRDTRDRNGSDISAEATDERTGTEPWLRMKNVDQ